MLEEVGENDNFWVKRYIVKYIINVVFVYGLVEYVGLIEVGKWVDLCLWDLVFFGVKFVLILFGGIIVVVLMGDLNVLILIF